MATISVLDQNIADPIDKIIFDIDGDDAAATFSLRSDGLVRILDLRGDAADVEFTKLCLAVDKARELGWGNKS